jgi:hypothetical protein
VVKGTTLKPTDLSGGEIVVDYEVEKQKNQVYFDWRRTLSAQDKKRVANHEIQGPEGPRGDWDIFRAVNPGTLQGYNGLQAEWWQGRAAFPELLKVLLQMTTQTPNDLDGAELAWIEACKVRGWGKPKEATASQLLNPAQGKGTNAAKSEFRPPNNLKGFWLLEWLKVVGLFHGGLTRIVANPGDPRNAKDR